MRHTFAADNSRWVVELFLTSLCDFIELLCSRKKVVSRDQLLDSFAVD
jgi:hypothetical protein